MLGRGIILSHKTARLALFVIWTGTVALSVELRG
jgi:hypothetical protein